MDEQQQPATNKKLSSKSIRFNVIKKKHFTSKPVWDAKSARMLVRCAVCVRNYPIMFIITIFFVGIVLCSRICVSSTNNKQQISIHLNHFTWPSFTPVYCSIHTQILHSLDVHKQHMHNIDGVQFRTNDSNLDNTEKKCLSTMRFYQFACKQSQIENQIQ